MAGATWLILATLSFPAMLAGCVQAIPDDPPPIDGGECYTVVEDCCMGCQPPTPRPPPIPPTRDVCAVHATNASSPSFSSYIDPCWTPPPPPLLAPFEAFELVEACAECGAVSLATDGGRAFLATRRELVVADGDRTLRLPLAKMARATYVAADAGGAWVAAIEDETVLGLSIPRLTLARYDGGGDFATTAMFDVAHAPPLALARRAYVAPVEDGAVVVLASEDAAWSVPFLDGAFGAAERITPLGGAAQVGAPVVDAHGRVLVPFAFAPEDPMHSVAPMLAPAPTTTSMYLASLGGPGATWATQGGIVVPQGVAAPPSLAMDADGRGAFTWLDDAARVMRVETWDDGGSWGTPAPWASWLPADAPPASATTGARATLAWWREPGALVVTRSDGGSRASATQVATESARPGETALALLSDGRAIVAWLTEEDALWLGVEGGAMPQRGECGDVSHCAPSRWGRGVAHA